MVLRICFLMEVNAIGGAIDVKRKNISHSALYVLYAVVL